jgi:hypothetical protein
VVELLGNTVRLPFACTAPTAGSIEISVALETDHRKVADWPRSIELGSAVNCAITGAAAGGGGVGVDVDAEGGGGGAGGGVFFLHPTANKASRTPIPTKLICLFLNMNSFRVAE